MRDGRVSSDREPREHSSSSSMPGLDDVSGCTPRGSKAPSRSSSCTTGHLMLAAFITLQWLAGLLLFTFAHIAAACARSGGSITFLVAASAMAAGAIVSGILSDNIGRRITARVMFGLGTMVCIAAIAAHPSDSIVLLVLLGSAGVAAGGSHVAAELLLEAVPPKYRALALVSYPAFFFPVGLVQSGIEATGWPVAVTLGSLVVGGAMAGLFFLLPESSRFVHMKAAAAAAAGGCRQPRRDAVPLVSGSRMLPGVARSYRALGLDALRWNAAYARVPAREISGSSSLGTSAELEDSSSPRGPPSSSPFSPAATHGGGGIGSPGALAAWAVPGTPFPGTPYQGPSPLPPSRFPADHRPLYLPQRGAVVVESSVPAPLAASDLPPWGRCGRGAQALRSGCRRSSCLRSSIPTLLCVIVTVSYWASSLTFFIPEGSADEHGTGAGYSALCAAYEGRPAASAPADAQQSLPTLRFLDAASILGGGGNSSSSSSLIGLACDGSLRPDGSGGPVPGGSNNSALATGLHLAAAEVVAVIAVALLADSPKLGRRYTVSLSLAAAAAAMLVGAVFFPSFGCRGSLLQAGVEFAVRASLAACAQALLLYTLEVSSTVRRSTAAGAFIALFRLGSLLTLANSLAPGAESRLQWTVYAVQHPYGVWGFGAEGGGASEGSPDPRATPAALAAVLAACAQACILGAVLALCLPVDTRLKALRDSPSDELVEAPPEQLVGSPGADLAATGRRFAAGVASRLDALSPAGRARRRAATAPVACSRSGRTGAQREQGAAPRRPLPSVPEYAFDWDPSAPRGGPGGVDPRGSGASASSTSCEETSVGAGSVDEHGALLFESGAAATPTHPQPPGSAATLLAPWLRALFPGGRAATAHPPSSPATPPAEREASGGVGSDALHHARAGAPSSRAGDRVLRLHSGGGGSGGGSSLDSPTLGAGPSGAGVFGPTPRFYGGAVGPRDSSAGSPRTRSSSVASAAASVLAGPQGDWQAAIDDLDPELEPEAASELAVRLDAAAARLFADGRVMSRRKAEFLHQEALRLRLLLRASSTAAEGLPVAPGQSDDL